MPKEIIQKMLVEELLKQIESSIQTFLVRHPDTDLQKPTAVRNIAEAIYSKIHTNSEEVPRNVEILKRLEERLHMGQLKYGQDIPINDGRDWLKEGLEEVLDGLVYLTNYMLELEKKRKEEDDA
tara:strand:+ start:913 stop:1284 length:372 start_codon:yes stop_codon:yes gene_type:complete